MPYRPVKIPPTTFQGGSYRKTVALSRLKIDSSLLVTVTVWDETEGAPTRESVAVVDEAIFLAAVEKLFKQQHPGGSTGMH